MPISARMFHGSDSGRGLAPPVYQKHPKRASRAVGLRNLIALVGRAVLKPSLQLAPRAAIAEACYRRDHPSWGGLSAADTMPISRASHLHGNK